MEAFAAGEAAVRPTVESGSNAVEDAATAPSGDIGRGAVWAATGWHTVFIGGRSRNFRVKLRQSPWTDPVSILRAE